MNIKDSFVGKICHKLAFPGAATNKTFGVAGPDKILLLVASRKTFTVYSTDTGAQLAAINTDIAFGASSHIKGMVQ